MSVKTLLKRTDVRVGLSIIAVAAVAVGLQSISSLKGSVARQGKDFLGSCAYTASPVTKINPNNPNSGYKSDYAIYLLTYSYTGPRSQSVERQQLSITGTKKETRNFGLDPDGGEQAIKTLIDAKARNFAFSQGYRTVLDQSVTSRCFKANQVPKTNAVADIGIDVINNTPMDAMNRSDEIRYTVRITNHGPDFAQSIPVSVANSLSVDSFNFYYNGTYPNYIESINHNNLSNFISLEAGESKDFNFTIRLSPDTPPLSPSATISVRAAIAYFVNTPSHTTFTDPNAVNNHARKNSDFNYDNLFSGVPIISQ